MSFRNFLRQPTTIAGLAAISGTLTSVLVGQMSWLTAVPIFAGAAVSIALPDNTAAKSDVTTLVAAAISAARDLPQPQEKK